MIKTLTRTYKFRLYPNQHQQERLAFLLEESRLLYNHCIHQRQVRLDYHQDFRRLSISHCFSKRKGFTKHLDVLPPWLRDSTINRADDRFDISLLRTPQKQPRNKSTYRFKTIDISAAHPVIKDNRLYADELPAIKIKKHRDFPEGYVALCHTLKRDHCGRWHLLVTFEYDTDILYKSRTDEVGIDLGLRTFAMLSDGLKINNPRIGIKYRKGLSACCNKIGTCYHDYRVFLPAVDKFWKLWERKYDKERNFIHQVTRSLINSYDVFYVEDIDVGELLRKNKDNRELSLQIMDSRWRLFISTLTYKAAGAGKRVVLVNPANTSQVCSNCGAVVKKDLDDRQHVCPSCGLSIDRDLNAARNILRRGARRGSKRANAPKRSSQTLFSPELIKELTDKYKHLFGTL